MWRWLVSAVCLVPLCFPCGVQTPTFQALDGINLGGSVEATPVLVLMNMVTMEELGNDQDYQGGSWCWVRDDTEVLCALISAAHGQRSWKTCGTSVASLAR